MKVMDIFTILTLKMVLWVYTFANLSKLGDVYILNIYNLLYVNYTSNKAVFRKKIEVRKKGIWPRTYVYNTVLSFQRRGMFSTHKIPFQNDIFLRMLFSRKTGIVFLKGAARLQADD